MRPAVFAQEADLSPFLCRLYPVRLSAHQSEAAQDIPKLLRQCLISASYRVKTACIFADHPRRVRPAPTLRGYVPPRLFGEYLQSALSSVPPYNDR